MLTRLRIRSSLVLLLPAVTLGACSADDDTAAPPTSTVEQALAAFPEIDFSARPSYLPSDVVALTFDDGPDATNTALVLDVLKTEKVKATFFINTENWGSVNDSPAMKALVQRIVAEGHGLANHTVHHPHLGSLSASDVESELAGVEATVRDPSVLGTRAPRLTLFRAPYGEPYQTRSAELGWVGPIVARHAVEVGWAIDSLDYDCADGPCVVGNVRAAVEAGSYGVILMHAVHAQTVAGLPSVIAYLRDTKRMRLWTAEDVVRARYGKSSAQVVDEWNGGTTGGTTTGGTTTGGTTGGCAGRTYTYPANPPYVALERVVSHGVVYACKPWPYTGWCSAGLAYEPGVGWAWADAWTVAGRCP